MGCLLAAAVKASINRETRTPTYHMSLTIIMAAQLYDVAGEMLAEPVSQICLRAPHNGHLIFREKRFKISRGLYAGCVRCDVLNVFLESKRLC